MSNRALTKQEEKLLREYAAKMPIVMQNAHEVHKMTGAELIEMGYVEQEGEIIIPEKMYAYNAPVQVAANHYRRLKKAWLKNGQDGLKTYISKITKLIHQHKETVNA